MQRSYPIFHKDSLGKWEIRSPIRLMAMGRMPKQPSDADDGFAAGDQHEADCPLNGAPADAQTDGVAAATPALEEARVALDRQLSDLSRQLDAANDELAQQRAHVERLQAAHANETAELQKTHAQAINRGMADVQARLEREFAERLAAARAQWTAEAEERVAASQRRADQSFDARLAEARARWHGECETALAAARQGWDAVAADRLAAKTREFEHETEQLRQQLDAANSDAAKAHERWQGECEATLAAARQGWDAVAADRLAAKTREFEHETEQLRQQLDAATNDAARAREQALADAQADHEREIAALRHAHESFLQERFVATTKAMEQDIQTRIEQTRRETEEKANAALAAAKQRWQADEATRLAAVRQDLEAELVALRDKLADATAHANQHAAADMETAHADEIAALKRHHAEELEAHHARTAAMMERRLTERVAKAHAQWQADADERMARALDAAAQTAKAELAQARQEWEVAEKERLAKSKASWKREEAHHQSDTAGARRGAFRRPSKAARRRARGQVVPRRWLPRRSLVIKAAAVAVLALIVFDPRISARIPLARTAVAEKSAVVASKLGSTFDGLVAKARKSELFHQILSNRPGETRADGTNRSIVEVARANLRAGPSTAANVVGTLDRGSEVVLLDERNGWHLVRIGDGANAQSGWVNGQLLRN